MTNKTIKYDIKYLENCNYNTSELKGECQIPQQNVDIDINIENDSALNRVGYNTTTQIDYQNNNKIYYNDVLKVTVSISIANIPTSIVNIGSLSIIYLNENMIPESLFGADIPVSKNGQVIFTFKPHYNGYIKIIYNDSSNFFITNEKQSDLIVLNKIPINTSTIANPMFISHEEETELTCQVVDIYGNNLNYGHVVFLGYHDIPRDSEDPAAGQEVVLGNPVPIINGIGKLKYMPEQDINIEYIVGHYNYYKEQYGHNFKYYEAHGSHTHVSTIQKDTLNFNLGVLKDNNIIDTTTFDGFIHLESNETIRANAILMNENNEKIDIKNDMELKLHIEGTKHIINKSYSDAKPKNVESWMKDNIIFEEYKNEIDLKNKTVDINNIPPGYYNIYATFKDGDKTDPNRIYYENYTSDIVYVAINQPTIVLNPIISYINPIENENNTYRAQVNDNLSINLQATCDGAYDNMIGKFTINNIDYKAKYENGSFHTTTPIRLNKIGDYYVYFSINASYNSNIGYYPTQNATPIILKIRDTLEPIIEIPKGYVDAEYPGQIKYILSVKNWYDETGIDISVKIKDSNNQIIQSYTEPYKGSSIQKQINNLSIGTYKIETTVNNKTTVSSAQTINKTTLIGEINSSSGFNIINGWQTNIQYDIKATKPVLTPYIIEGAKIYAKKDNIIIPFNITTENIILNSDRKTLSIYYPILLYLDGDWDIRFTQAENSNFNSSIFTPNDDNLNSFITESQTYHVSRIQPYISINKDNDNIVINISNNGVSNNQILLFDLKLSYGNYQTINVPVLMNGDSITIPLTRLHEDFESISIRQQIFNIKVTLDPFNDELMEEINGKNIDNIKTALLEEYDKLYNIVLLDSFASQIKDNMLYTALFGTYDKTIKSESYAD